MNRRQKITKEVLQNWFLHGILVGTLVWFAVVYLSKGSA